VEVQEQRKMDSYRLMGLRVREGRVDLRGRRRRAKAGVKKIWAGRRREFQTQGTCNTQGTITTCVGVPGGLDLTMSRISVSTRRSRRGGGRRSWLR
jgi:hypothetical protein